VARRCLVALLSSPSSGAEREAALKDGLTRGIAWAIGFIKSQYDYDSVARDMARNAGIKDKAELLAAGVDQYDLDCIGDVLPAESPSGAGEGER
jgi:hypothetical protein